MKFCNVTQQVDYYYINLFNRKYWATDGSELFESPGDPDKLILGYRSIMVLCI
jgi:hypothetical protein